MRRIEEARRDPAAFVQFCFLSEESHQPIELVDHQRLVLRFAERFRMCVIRMPRNASKTFLLSAYGLYLLGHDVSGRGAILSAVSKQSARPVGSMMEHVESNQWLRLVFPRLTRHPDPNAPWSKWAFNVRRPDGIKTPSMTAAGLAGQGAIGARRKWVLVDDVLNGQNTLTREARDKVMSIINTSVIGTLDPLGPRCIVTNTPWDRDDLTYRLEKIGWPSITMSIEGAIKFGGKIDRQTIEKEFGDLIRPSRNRIGDWRLRSHDPDPDERVCLWPERLGRDYIDQMRLITTPFEFARMHMCEPMSSDAARCQQEWIDAAFERGQADAFPVPRQLGWYYFTGVDIGGIKKTNDLSSICTIGLAPDGMRKICNLQSGRWHGGEMIARILKEATDYDSDVYIESNAAQKYIHDFAQDKANTQARTRALRLHTFNTTGRNKHDAEYGVEAVFTEMLRNRWIWPTPGGQVPPELKELADECLFYNPEQHTGDRLMSLFLARQGLARPGRGEGAGRGKLRQSAAAGGGY